MSDMNFDLAPGWLPNEGDVIVGTVTDLSRQRSNVGRQDYYPIITLTVESPVIVAAGEGKTRTADSGESVAVHAFHNVLKARVVELRPTIGDRIGIKYLQASVKTGKKGNEANTPHVYIVKVEGKQQDIYSGMSHPYEDAVNTFPVSDLQDDEIPF